MDKYTLFKLATVIWIPSTLLLLAVPGTAATQTPTQYTVERAVKFTAGTEKERVQWRKIPAAREIVESEFAYAKEDLNGDGRPELILLSRSPSLCRDGGCALLVLQKPAQGIDILLATKVPGALALTMERVDGYRALALLDATGQIAIGNRSGSPLFGKQVIYPMRYHQAQAQTGSATSEAAPAKESTSSANATDQKVEKVIEKFLFSATSNQENAESSGSSIADLNGDGKPEIVLVWTLLGPTYWRNTLTIFSKTAKGYEPVSSFLLEGFANLSSTNNGIIIVDQTIYAKDDPICCPSIKKKIKYKWSDDKIVKIKD